MNSILHQPFAANTAHQFARSICAAAKPEHIEAIAAYGQHLEQGTTISRPVTVAFYRGLYGSNLPGYRDLSENLKAIGLLDEFENMIAIEVHRIVEFENADTTPI